MSIERVHALRPGLAAYTLDVVRLLEAVEASAQGLPSLTYHRFDVHPPHGMNGRPELRPDWFGIVQSLRERITSLPSYAVAKKALLAEPLIAERLKRPIGHSIVLHHLRIEDVLVDLPCETLGYLPTATFDDARFASAFERLTSLLLGNTASIDVTAPMIGFDSDSDELTLSNDLCISRLSEVELHRLGRDWWTGVLAFDLFGPLIPQFAIRYRWRAPDLRPGLPSALASNGEDSPPKVHVRRLHQALRLFGDGYIGVPLLIFRHEPWHPERLGQSAHMIGAGAAHGMDRYNLPSSATPALMEFWESATPALARLSRRGELALRRFDLALERRWPEDGVVDFAVAIEAAMRRDPQEKSPHLAKRAADLIDQDRHMHSRIERDCLALFRMRNRILHEGLASLHDAFSEHGAAKEFIAHSASATRAVLRAALLKGQLGAIDTSWP